MLTLPKEATVKQVVLVLVTLCVSSAVAKSEDSVQVALQLGTIIGSEKACHLKLDQNAIRQCINEHVTDADLSFPATLNTMTGGTEYNIESMSESALTAHCTQIRRLVQRYGLSVGSH
jgi:hypothetical protein